MSLTAYRALTWMSGPLVRRYLKRRLETGKEDPNRHDERLGIPSETRPDGPLVWVHAASVGESLSMVTLIERLSRQRPGINILMTSGTVSSAQILKHRLPERVIHQFVPLDRVRWTRKFLDHWQPDFVLWVESEFWPALLSEVRARDIPAFLMNARISTKSMRGWKRIPWMIKPLLRTFELCMAQTERDADRLTILGAQNVVCPGNLKFAADPLPANSNALATMEEMICNRPRWIAFSTHQGEEEVIAGAHMLLKQNFPDLLTILVPRHPARGKEIGKTLVAKGMSISRRSLQQQLVAETDILLADTMGELGLFFRAADIAFVGGSLVPHGGQNPIEPARLGCAIIHGRHMHNFLGIEGELKAAGASVVVQSSNDIAKEVDLLLSNKALRQRRIAASRSVAQGKFSILDAVFAYLDPALNRLAPAQPIHVSRNARA